VLGGGDGPATEVRTLHPERLAAALERRGHRVERDGDRLLGVGAAPEQVGAVAAEGRAVLVGLAPRERSLEAAFFALTGGQG
jgi:ABC-2 type transport system ATP-binding protein